MKNFIKIIPILLTLVFFVTGCNPERPFEEADDKVPSMVIEPGKSLIFGNILNAATNKPVNGSIVLSRNLTYDQIDLPPTISFSLQSDPNAEYDLVTGEFAFRDIEPGEDYVLVVHYGPGNILVVLEESSDYPLQIEAKADQALDLGTIKVNEP